MFKKLLLAILICGCFASNYALQKPVKRVYASSPTLLYMLYAIDFNAISGVNFEFNNYEKPYLKEQVLNQPFVSGFLARVKCQTPRYF
ncbi:hypothetical protein [Campylobacter gastrosuis]|uniref:Lipoprotein n=1 Tax=Campylobacter gastrosuis TaxID=2974576 RepID=A0ABT7HRW4_9BACT|nr:hypothetical protein [Campylobacter gastrosuis]MDL0089593.1 hypothetical protein [Campylobacter gastrosuis]